MCVHYAHTFGKPSKHADAFAGKGVVACVQKQERVDACCSEMRPAVVAFVRSDCTYGCVGADCWRCADSTSSRRAAMKSATRPTRSLFTEEPTFATFRETKSPNNRRGALYEERGGSPSFTSCASVAFGYTKLLARILISLHHFDGNTSGTRRPCIHQEGGVPGTPVHE